LSEGILSHNLSMEKNPKRIADAGIVAYRNNKMLTSGYPLTYYANFYFQPKNPMLYRILKENTPNQENIIVFELKLNINSNDIFVSDGNCARKISQIETLPAQNIFLSIDKMMSKSSWNNENYWEFMAECLIPEKVEVSFIQTIHVQNEAVEHEIHNIIQEKFPTLRNIQIQKNPSMFFS